ncbi:MAG TPA: hypothetical protein PKA27_15215 [Fimbriimonadaceae bacterium]|nr:hypothetical protein [Fimbriimonadaceae bacterium]
MATIAPKNYLSKIDEFAAHWPLVNTALGSPVILSGNYLVATLGTDRTALAAQITAVEAAINTNQGAIATRDTLRASIKERMRQFNQIVRGAFPGSTYVNMLPKIPNIAAAPGLWMKAMADMNNVWTQINAMMPIPVGSPVPLVLSGVYNLATFALEQNTLNAAFTAIESTEEAVASAIRVRDSLWNPIYDRLKQYRLSVQGRFPSGAPLLDSLPSLTPPPGSTPAPVNISGVWNAGISKAVITYTASTAPNLASYQLRASYGGTKYNAAAEAVVDTHLAGDLTPFETNSGLVASGSKVFFKVYVVVDTGNERGSNAVSVTRP